MIGSAEASSTLLKKLGFLALGLVFLGYTAVWPMYRVSQGEPNITISFKGIAVSALLTAVAFISLLLGERGIPMKKVKGQSLTFIQRMQIAASVALTLVIIAIVWFYFSAHGYNWKV